MDREVELVSSELQGVVSDDRVKKHGEVYTPDTIVCDMLGLIDESDLTSTYLEPSCGNGNFLIRILDKKLNLIDFNKEEEEVKIDILKAVSSIYGIDILPDNVEESKRRMIEVLVNGSTQVLGEAREWKRGKLAIDLDKKFMSIVRYILDLNIQCGNTLTSEHYIVDASDHTKYAYNKFDPDIMTFEQSIKDLRITQFKFEGTKVSISDTLFENIKNGIDMDVLYGTSKYTTMTNLKPLQAYEKALTEAEKQQIIDEQEVDIDDV